MSGPAARALLSGVLLTLAFPGFGHPACAWVALAPLCTVLADRRVLRPGPASVDPLAGRHPRRAVSPEVRGWRLGWLTGISYFGGTLYWLSDVMVTFGDLGRPVAVLLNVLLVAFLALFPSVFGLMQARLVDRMGPRALALAPALWVGTELARRYLFGGFPWVLVGYSQTDVLPIAQLASVTGVYGVSALVVAFNAALAYAAVAGGRAGVLAVATALALVGGVGWAGARRIAAGAATRGGTPVRVALVQGNIAQEDKWNPALAGRILDTYVALSRDAAARGARLIIWPESATPFYFEEEPVQGERLRAIARELRAYLLFGSDELDGSRQRAYNAAYLVRPDGATAGVYRKMHLVPFGEYIPFRRMLFFAAPLVESVADFSPGDSVTIFPVDGRRASTAICYEVVYADLIRRFVVAGSELLTTITNDAWYGRSSAPHQHFQQAAMRAVEQGRYLVRAANTGISGVVDPYGRTLERSALFTETVIVRDVRFLRASTVYARIGDAFAWASALLTLAAVVAVRRRPRREGARHR